MGKSVLTSEENLSVQRRMIKGSAGALARVRGVVWRREVRAQSRRVRKGGRGNRPTFRYRDRGDSKLRSRWRCRTQRDRALGEFSFLFDPMDARNFTSGGEVRLNPGESGAPFASLGLPVTLKQAPAEVFFPDGAAVPITASGLQGEQPLVNGAR